LEVTEYRKIVVSAYKTTKILGSTLESTEMTALGHYYPAGKDWGFCFQIILPGVPFYSTILINSSLLEFSMIFKKLILLKN
jgi:hypothetical protein